MERRQFLAAAGLSATPLVIGHESWDQHVYITERLIDEVGRIPLDVACTYISKAFQEIRLDYTLEIHPEPVVIDNYETACGATFYEWAEHDLDGNSNLCLTAAPSGGCGYIGGNMATIGAKHMVDSDHAWVNTGNYGFNIHCALHEIAHNAGYTHGDRVGRAWYDKGRINVTPMTSPKVEAGTSICGHDVPEIESGNRVFHHYYTDCAADLFKKETGSVDPVCEVIGCD